MNAESAPKGASQIAAPQRDLAQDRTRGVRYPDCYKQARHDLALGHFTRQPAARRRRAEAEVMSKLSRLDHKLKVDFAGGSRIDLEALASSLGALADEVAAIQPRTLAVVR